MDLNTAMEILNLRMGYSKSDVKHSYRKLAREFHPDMGGSSEDFARLEEAYNVCLNTTVEQSPYSFCADSPLRFYKR